MMAAKKKEAATQEKEVKKNDGTPDNITTDKSEPDDQATAEAKELADEEGTDDKTGKDQEGVKAKKYNSFPGI